jgi:hypothetical protein
MCIGDGNACVMCIALVATSYNTAEYDIMFLLASRLLWEHNISRRWKPRVNEIPVRRIFMDMPSYNTHAHRSLCGVL